MLRRYSGGTHEVLGLESRCGHPVHSTRTRALEPVVREPCSMASEEMPSSVRTTYAGADRWRRSQSGGEKGTREERQAGVSNAPTPRRWRLP